MPVEWVSRIDRFSASFRRCATGSPARWTTASRPASAALGARRYLDVAVDLAVSLARRPRLGLHLGDWWQTRPASAQELAATEALAALPAP